MSLGLNLSGSLLTIQLTRSEPSENWKVERIASLSTLRSVLTKTRLSTTQTTTICSAWDSLTRAIDVWFSGEVLLETGQYLMRSGLYSSGRS